MRIGVVLASFLVAACSSGDGGTDAGTGSGGGGAGNAPKEIALGLAVNTPINLDLTGASQDAASGAITDVDVPGQFFIRAARDDARVFRYGRVGEGKVGPEPRRHTYRVPIEVVTVNGQVLNSGTLDVVRSEEGFDILPLNVGGREFVFNEVALSAALAGVLEVQTNLANADDRRDVYGYSGGVAATDLPTGNVDYSGSFVATTLSSSGVPARFADTATLSIDFANGQVSGALGSTISLTGTQASAGISGTAAATADGFGVVSGSSGTFSGGLYGLGAREAGASLEINSSDGNGGLIGAFGVSAD